MKKHIPNFVTCCNLFSGCVAVGYALMGNPALALLWIVMGAVFDFFDGMVARLLHVSSPIGKELDSLADVVTFGVAPASILFYELSVMEYPAFLHSSLLEVSDPWRSYLPYFAYVMASFSALRLAKFNLDERQSLGFIGMPTPANALFWGALIVGGGAYIESASWMLPVLLCGIVLSSWLMISEIPMFALKFKQWIWKGNEVKYVFVLTCIPLLLLFGILGLSIVIAWYVLLSVVLMLKSKA